MIKKTSHFNLLLSLWIIACFTIYGTGDLRAGDFEAGKSFHGFKLLKQKKIKEMNALGLYFEHTKSGAHLLKIKNTDDNNTFGIAFKTPPHCDCGTSHIMEHSVMNGSKNYPVKSPYDVLKKGSLHTFLNALTLRDVTLYPVASRNDKDFFNMMGIYLDAVFYPRIYEEPKIFKREGWHYALDNKKDELNINGIVYNEVQGAFSRTASELFYLEFKHLFPDNAYGKAYGGYPDAIPELSYQRFLEFHKIYYHPSNSFIFLCGDGNLMEELEYIDKNYLSKFDKVKVVADIPLQKPFKKMKEITREYAISNRGNEKDNTWFALSFVTGQSTQRDTTLALEILSDVLLSLPGSPVRRALVDAGIGKEMFGIFSAFKQNIFSFVVSKANASDKEKFKQIVFSTLKKLVTKGIDKKMLEGSLNRLEFRFKEGTYPGRGFPRRVQTCRLVLSGWMYANDPFMALEYENTFKKLKKGLKTGYYEKIIENYLLNNNHCVLIVLKPKKGLGEEKKKQLKEKLAAYKASLSDKELDNLVNETEELKEYQKTPDSPEDLKKIPMLSLKDVNPKAERLEVEEREISGVKVLVYPTFTDNIVHQRLLFDASVLPRELIPYVSLLGELLCKMSTKNYSYGDLDTELNIHTGGLYFYPEIYLRNSDGKILPKFEVRARVLPEKLAKLMELEGEIIKNTLFNDAKRLQEVIAGLNARYEMMINISGLYLARIRLRSYLTPYGKYLDLTQGLSFCRFLFDLAENFDAQKDDVMANLQKTAELLFNKNNMIAAVTCSEEDYKKFKEKFPIVLPYIGDKTPKQVNYTFEFKEKNEGIQSSSRVQFVTRGYNYKALGYTYSGKFVVLGTILERDYLQRMIRVLGGAYGRNASFSRSGFAYFGSYRDPHLVKTLDAYNKAADFLKNFDVDDLEMTRFILGAISLKDRLLLPRQKGRQAVSNYLENVTYADIQKERDEILSTTPEAIRKMAKMVTDIMVQNTICVFGNEKKLEENKKLFDKLINIKQ